MTDAVLSAPFENQRQLVSFQVNSGGTVYFPDVIATFDNAASGFATPVSAGWNLQPTAAPNVGSGLSVGDSGTEARSAISDGYVTTNAFALRDGSVFNLNTTVNDGDGSIFFFAEHGGNDNNISVTPGNIVFDVDLDTNVFEPIDTWSLDLDGSDYAAITTSAEYSRNGGTDTVSIAATTFTLNDFTGGTGSLTGVTAFRIDGANRVDPAVLGVASIPEPSAFALIFGLAGMIAFLRRRV